MSVFPGHSDLPATTLAHGSFTDVVAGSGQATCYTLADLLQCKPQYVIRTVQVGLQAGREVFFCGQIRQILVAVATLSGIIFPFRNFVDTLGRVTR